MNSKISYLIAFILIALMGTMATLSVADDSATIDELAHLPAGYTYLAKQDMRLNPEHPPLIKDLAALPLLFIKGINFPSDIKEWKEDLNGQWDFGRAFLYKFGNDADKILFWSRISMIAVTLFLGSFLFFWIRSLWGNDPALLTLFLYVFSPTFLAHGRLVATDVGAASGVVLATAFFLNFLKNPSWKNTLFAGLAFGVAQLIKFNMILLYPFFGILLLVWVTIHVPFSKVRHFHIQDNIGTSLLKFTRLVAVAWIDVLKYIDVFLRNALPFFVKFILIIVLAWILIWPVYAFHTQNLPKEKQLAYVEEFTRGHPARKVLIPLATFLSQHEPLRPWGYYTLGVGMATQAAIWGSGAYFMGEASTTGWIRYFPMVYILKEPLAFHILTIIALFSAALAIKKPSWIDPLRRTHAWLRSHFAQFAMLLWIFIYWTAALANNLNIGIRHLLPVLPFTYALTALAIAQWIQQQKTSTSKIPGSKTEKTEKQYSYILKNIMVFLPRTKLPLVILLIVWQAYTVITVYPHFISYFNELAGGPSGGSRYVVDSNVDWGQDLKRLANYVKENNIEKIKVAYFGGGSPEYYLGDRAESFKIEEPQKGWVAVSATILRDEQALPSRSFDEATDKLYWLFPYKPVTVIGNSIFVYNIP